MDPQEDLVANVGVAEIIRATTSASLAIKHLTGYSPFIVKPIDMEIEYIDPERPVPLRDYIEQHVRLDELESFNAYVKQFATNTARIFATTTPTGANFVAVLNYHESGTECIPRRASHRAQYTPQYSQEFAAWLAQSGKPMTQEAFLDFLRRWGAVIRNYTDADLIEIASSLNFKTNVDFTTYVERVKGGQKLNYTETIDGVAKVGGKSVTLPDSLTMSMPVFDGGKEYTMGAEVLYRPSDGKLRIFVELRRIQTVIRQAVLDLVKDVEAGTGITPFIGAVQ